MTSDVAFEINFWDDDQLLVRLAREIAIDHYELEEILRRYQISTQQWDRIKGDKYFTSILAGEIAAWNETSNTHERSKLKAAAVIEDWLPEAHKMLHARGETLTGRVALAQLLTKIAGMGVQAAEVGVTGGSDKFVININLGEKKELRIEKVINAELGSVEDIKEEEITRAIPDREKWAASGGGVKVVSEFDRMLNPAQLVKKWSV